MALVSLVGCQTPPRKERLTKSFDFCFLLFCSSHRPTTHSSNADRRRPPRSGLIALSGRNGPDSSPPSDMGFQEVTWLSSLYPHASIPFLSVPFAPYPCHPSHPFFIASSKFQVVHDCLVRENENESKKGGNMYRHQVSQGKKKAYH